MAEIYLPPKTGYQIEGSHIRSDGKIKGKVTGTMMGGILGCSPWSSPFQVACTLLGLASKDISGKPAVKAGQALEGTVIEYMGEHYPEVGLFVPAEEIYEKREGDHDAWASDFDDEYFAGHVDGIVMSPSGENYILEVKTSSNMDSWASGVPIYYFWQVALYNHFVTQKDKAYVALGIMDPEALKDPSTWNPGENNTALIPLELDQDMIAQTLDKVREWYDTYIANGITPDYDPTNIKDVELYNHLMNLTDTVENMGIMISQLAEVKSILEEKEAETAPLRELEENLKSRLKEYMDCHDLTELESDHGPYRAVLTTSVRKKIDPEKIRSAGLDPADFTIETITKSFTLKEIKE